jgi:hypothetical protein
MTINIDNLAVIEQPLSPEAQFQITIDISDWLDTDTISTVAYTAVDGQGGDASTDVLDSGKHTNTTTVIKPYIDCTKGPAVSGMSYTVKMKVVTTAGDQEAWYLKFKVREFA